jgi:FkbM family methyltransferase
MGLKSKKFKNWTISFLNESELDEMLNELYSKNFYTFKTTKPDPVIFDVGALIGETAIFFKDKYPQAKIVAFEPSPRSFSLLKRNITQNYLKNVQVVNAAVSSKAGKMNFYTSKLEANPWGRGDSLNQNKFNNKKDSKIVPVSVVKLSNYIKGQIDLLKLDIEGSETEVLKEIEPKLKYISQIILEFHYSVYNPKNNFNTIIEILKNNDYDTSIYLSRWLLPNLIIGPITKLLSLLRPEEYWLRIYAKRPN